MPAWRIAAAASALVAYALLSNWLMLHAANEPWAVAALFGPLLLAVAGAGWQRRQWPTLAGCGVLVVVLAVIVARGGIHDMQRMYVLQHAAIHLTLAWTFAITLRRQSTPLITVLAEGLHRRLGQAFSPAMHAYTRKLTALWVGYFVGMVLVSLTIYHFAPWPWWSFYCNMLTPAAAGAFFIVEHAVRYRLHPEFVRVSLRAAFEAYQRGSRAARS